MSTWTDILQNPTARKIICVTIDPLHRDPSPMGPHLALQPGVVRLATERIDVPSSAGTLPFWPWLVDWPVVDVSLSPQDRRAEIGEVQMRVMSDSGLGDLLLGNGGGQAATARVDLLSPDMSLDQAWCLAAGRISTAPRIDRRFGGVSFSVIDGDPYKSVTFPPGPIDRLLFPDAPRSTNDLAPRQVIFGPFPQQVVCPQIGPTSCYICEGSPPFTQAPTVFYRNGVQITQDIPRVQSSQSSGGQTSVTFAELVFNATLNPVDVISCSLGVGQTQINPILFLLENQGGFQLTPEARQLILTSPFQFSVLLNSTGDVLDIVRNQLLPQTDLVGTFRRGLFHVYSLTATTPQMRLGVGTGLLFRLPDDQQDPETPLDSVFNHFEVLCGRNQFMSTVTEVATLATVLRDKDHGGSDAIRSLLARSERFYGPRALTGSNGKGIEAADLVVEVHGSDLNTATVTCQAGERLADVLATVHAMAGRQHSYMAEWFEGMSMDVNSLVLLTDPAEGLQDTPGRCVRRRITADGPVLTFLTTQEPAPVDVPGVNATIATGGYGITPFGETYGR